MVKKIYTVNSILNCKMCIYRRNGYDLWSLAYGKLEISLFEFEFGSNRIEPLVHKYLLYTDWNYH